MCIGVPAKARRSPGRKAAGVDSTGQCWPLQDGRTDGQTDRPASAQPRDGCHEVVLLLVVSPPVPHLASNTWRQRSDCWHGHLPEVLSISS